MNLPKIRKGSPLLLLVLLTIGAITVGAMLVNLWTSQIIPDVHQVTTNFRGVDAQLIQSGNWQAYRTPASATTLVDQMYGVSNLQTFASGCTILVIYDYDLPTEDLTMTISVFETGTTTPYDGWTCTATFVEFWNDGNGYISPDTVLAVGRGPWTITHAQIDDMVYDPDAGPNSPQTGDYNALILSFEFTGVSTLMEYAEDWSPTMDFTTIMDMTVSLGVEG